MQLSQGGSIFTPRGPPNHCCGTPALTVTLRLVNSSFFFLVGFFGPFSCCFASLGSLFHFLMASTFQQERGLSLCVSTAVHVSCLLFLGWQSVFSDIFCFYVFVRFRAQVVWLCPFWYIAFDRCMYRICCNTSVVIFRMLTVQTRLHVRDFQLERQ